MSKHFPPRAFRGATSLRADAGDANAILARLNKAFDDFKAENDKRLADLARGQEDVVRNEKVDRINAALSELQAALDQQNERIANLAMAGLGGGRKIRDADYSKSFLAHMRRGDVQASLNKGAASEGGYLTPVEWDRTIADRLVQISPMRGICSVMTISTNGFSKLFNNRGTTSGWVGEADPRPATATPTLGPLTFNTGELYANPAATQQILDDAEIDLENWLAAEVDTEFAYQEGVAFLTGNGTNKPNGILTYITGGANAATHPWGAILTRNSGAAAALTADGLVDLIYELPSEYSGQARFVMNRMTHAAVRKLKGCQR